jgi:flagellar hook assembly protein FlgD/predicted SnoaL-like aldol condensation-catalyzing enzyme
MPNAMRIFNEFYQRYFSIVFLFSIILISGFIFGVDPKEGIFSPVAASTGNMLYNPENPLENQLYLGGALGVFNRPGFYGGYNLIPMANEYWGSVFLPRSEGVFGLTWFHSSSDLDKKLSRGLVQSGFGKSLTENLSFGFFFSYQYVDLSHLTSVVGFEPSIIYSINPTVKQGQVFAVHNFFVYSAFRRVDIYNSDGNIFNPSFHLGAGAKLVKIKDFSAGLQVEDSIDQNAIRSTPVSIALNLGYSIFQLRAGYRLDIPLNNDKMQPGTVSLGAGLYAPNDLMPGLIFNAQYSINGFETRNLEHRVALGVIFNYVDKTAPVLRVTPDYNQFSPNGDGRQDFIVFHIDVKDASPITQWRLVIKNAKGETVKTFEKDRRKRSVFFPLYRIFTDLFKRGEYRYIPESITWDGTSQKLNTTASTAANPPAIKLPDGSYFYEMTVTDEKTMSNNANGTVVIDTVFPDVIVKRDTKSENHNNLQANQQNKIFLAIAQFTSARADEIFTGTIYNDSGKSVKSWLWKEAANLPKTFSWNGTDQNGVPVQEGIYEYELKAVDAAGNQSTVKIEHVNVFYGNSFYDVIAETPGFSPNGDGIMDTINFSFAYIGNAAGNGGNTQGGMVSWAAYLTREKIKDLKDFTDSLKKKNNTSSNADAPVVDSTIQTPENFKYVFTWSGDKSNFLNRQSWSGKDTKERPVEDGYYYFTLVVKTKEGAFFKSESTRIALDTAPPDVRIQPWQDSITPDGDGINDNQFLKSLYRDQSDIKGYRLTLYEILIVNGSKIRVPFKTWSAKNAIPGRFYIDGASDQGLGMESLKEYEYDFEVSDIYENTAKKTGGSFFTGVIVNNFGSYLKVTINGLTPGIMKNNIFSSENTSALDRVFNVLMNDYPAYRIRVEGHTGNAGDEETNLRNSEQRAKNIMRYFIDKGMPVEKIGFQGFGDIMPLTEIDNEINNYKNDRLEFILMK